MFYVNDLIVYMFLFLLKLLTFIDSIFIDDQLKRNHFENKIEHFTIKPNYFKMKKKLTHIQ